MRINNWPFIGTDWLSLRPASGTCAPGNNHRQSGSPPDRRATRIPASSRADNAMPPSSSRWGGKPLRRLSSNRPSSTRVPPSPPARICNLRLPVPTVSTSSIMPMAAPVLIPSISGLAMGLRVSRCTITPAPASSAAPRSRPVQRQPTQEGPRDRVTARLASATRHRRTTPLADNPRRAGASDRASSASVATTPAAWPIARCRPATVIQAVARRIPSRAPASDRFDQWLEAVANGLGKG